MRLRIIFYLVFSSFVAFPQSYWIDQIQTDEDINFFIWNNFSSKYPNFSVADTNNIFNFDDYKLIADTLKMKYWYKEDFNNDYHSDLLVYGSYSSGQYIHPIILGIIDEGKGSYKLYRLSNTGIRDFGVFFPVVQKHNSDILIIRYQVPEVDELMISRELNYKVDISTSEIIDGLSKRKGFKLISDTLIYKHGSFIEYNPNQSSEEITEFNFKNHCGMLACYVMDITINPDGSAKILAGDYNDEKKEYNLTLADSLVREVFALIRYIEPTKLKNNYSDFITDSDAVTTNYTTISGDHKHIYDYGSSATFGLKKLYSIMFELKEKRQWLN